MHRSATALTVFLLAATACPLHDIEHRLARADDHLFWAEFWTDLDDAEAGRELGYAIDDLQQAEDLTQGKACSGDDFTRTTARLIQRRLAACLRSSQAVR